MAGKSNLLHLEKQYPKVKLNNLQRNLYLSVIGEHGPNVPIIFMMHKNNPKNLEPMLRWLIKNKIVGQRFHQFFYGEMEASPLKLFCTLNAKIERDKNVRPLFAGRDF